MQFEVGPQDDDLKSRLSKLDKLLKLLPTQFDVSSTRIGAKHTKEEHAEEAATELREKLQSAAEGKLQTAPKEALSDGAYFADNHKAMLEEIGVKAVAKPGLFGRMFGRK